MPLVKEDMNMAKQSINMFKEPGKVLIEISNPSKDTMKALDDMFGKSIVDLANILLPLDMTSEDKNEKEQIEAKIAASKTDNQENVAIEESPKKPRDVLSMSGQEAKEWLRAFLISLEKNPALKFNAYRVLSAYAIARNRRELINDLNGKSEEVLHEFFCKKNIAKSIAKLIEYEVKSEEMGWV